MKVTWEESLVTRERKVRVDTDRNELERFVQHKYWRAEVQHGFPFFPVEWCNGEYFL